jgi:ATP-dependent RNA helicase DeaD
MGFSKMGLNPKLVEGLKQMGIKEPTPIQAKCIPELKAGRDLVGQSLTGSGKTAAFGLPILEKVVPGNGLQALVLTPTRELCVQVRDNLEAMARYLPINIKSIYGGVGFYQQIEDLKIAEIIVATPGRLLDHMGRRNVDLRGIKFIVLDEADRMFDMGFEDDIEKIMRQTPNSRQTIMFSATMPRAAQNLANKYLKNPCHIQEKLHVDKSLLKQVFYSVRRDDKYSLLVHLLKSKTSGPAIVFCGTKREVDKVARNLRKQNLEVLPVHGDLTQGKRQFAVNSFKQGKIDVLVATDVAARGLDIKDVSHVYNYDVPRTPEEYTHRIGRTARAGKRGDAVTLVSDRDYDNFNKLLRYGKHDILQERLPEFERIEMRKDFGRERDFDSQEHGRQRGWQDNNQRRQFGHGHSQNRERGQESWGKEREHTHGKHKRPFQERGRFQRNESYNSQAPQEYNNQKSFGHRPREGQRQRQHPQPRSQPQRQREETQIVSGGQERTPRTLKPLFPESHYHPNYKPKKDSYENEETFRPARMHKPTYRTDKNKSFHSDDTRRSSHSKSDKTPFYKQNTKKKFRGKKRY